MRPRMLGAIATPLALLSACAPLSVPTSPSDVGTVVVAVIDGDTIDVQTSAGVERVRIIGIDTPELGYDGEPDECWAAEARDALADRIDGQAVELHADASQGDVDAYDRLLRHVELDDGTQVGQWLLEAGAAYEYTYDQPYEHRDDYLAAEAAASASGAGLWGAC